MHFSSHVGRLQNHRLYVNVRALGFTEVIFPSSIYCLSSPFHVGSVPFSNMMANEPTLHSLQSNSYVCIFSSVSRGRNMVEEEPVGGEELELEPDEEPVEEATGGKVPELDEDADEVLEVEEDAEGRLDRVRVGGGDL